MTQAQAQAPSGKLAERFHEGDLVEARAEYVRRHPEWAGAQGVITQVVHRVLPAVRVLWCSGPREGREELTPYYMIRVKVPKEEA